MGRERGRERKGELFFYSRMTGNKDRRNYKIEKNHLFITQYNS